MKIVRSCSCALLLLAGCNFARLESTALPAPIMSTQLPDATSPPAATLTSSPAIELAVATVTPLPTRPTAAPSPTRAPWQHVIRDGETLGYIIQQYGYRSFDVIEEIVRLNENIASANLLPGEGSVILIPRPSATPVPADFTPLPVPPALVEGIAPTSPATGLNYTTAIDDHVVVAGQSVVDIVVQHNTTLEIVSILNPEITFAGCDFGVASGGPNCNPFLSVGQTVRVPAPTPTPTLSPTFSGAETATPTPTWMPPRVISPPQNAILPATTFRLQWLSVGVLAPDEVYLVQLSDESSVVHNAVTRETSLMLPEALVPTDGISREMSWTVSVARANAEGVYQIIGGYPQPRRFLWNSRSS